MSKPDPLGKPGKEIEKVRKVLKALGHKPLVYIRYLDHVLFNRSDPLALKPETRETVGWLLYECDDYVIVCWDCDAGPPSLKNHDPKATGLVILRPLVLELRRLG